MEQQPTLTRMDKNIAHNLADFSYYPPKDAELIKKLSFFFCHDFQWNICSHTLSGTRILDPADIALALGYQHTKSLNNPHPDPAQLKEPKFANLTKAQLKELKKRSKTGEGEPLFDTVLDNALYLCRYESLRLSKKGKTFDGATTSELNEIRFLKSLKKFYHPIKNKIYYEVEYDQTMINDLARFYLKFDFSIYKALKSTYYQDFYISLINLRDRNNLDNQTHLRINISFDNLCALARTTTKEPSERKRFINNAIKAINQFHGAQFVTIKWLRNGQHKFLPQLDFTVTEKELLFMATDAKAKFKHFLLHNLKEAFQAMSQQIKDPDEYKRKFIRFLTDADWLFEVKHAQMMKTWLQCIGKEVEDPWSSKILNYIKEEIPKMAEQPLWPNNILQISA